MAIYAIADLHLSFSTDKPMNIFGENWEKHEKKIKENWISKVNMNDTVIIPGDFSWAMYLKDTELDFKYLKELPGKKILLKGNHDYWWTTLKKMDNFLQDNGMNNINFLYNNSYLVENKIIVGTRGWNILDCDKEKKMIKREAARLELSITDAIKKYGDEKEIIAFMHYPPINKNDYSRREKTEFISILEKFNIKRCYYGHLHGTSHKEAIEGIIYGIEFNLISADFLNFDLKKIN